MNKTVVSTDRAPLPKAPFSQAVVFNNIVFTAGTVGVDPETGKVAEGGIKSQVDQTLNNLDAILKKANSSLENALKVNVYLKDIGDFPAFNEVYSKFFDLDAPPARTTVEVGPFAIEELLVEIDIIGFSATE